MLFLKHMGDLKLFLMVIVISSQSKICLQTPIDEAERLLELLILAHARSLSVKKKKQFLDYERRE